LPQENAIGTLSIRCVVKLDLNEMMREEPTVVVYFDGECALCHSSVDFIIRHDPNAEIYFASLQSAKGRSALVQLGMSLESLDSIVLQEGVRYSVRSTAVLRIAARLSGAVKLLSWLRFLPLCLRDPVYDWIAQHRYRWFGRKNSCGFSSKGQQGRFIG
jgi:predicted DCC family thiol-disulfide oxidoreductase YuxK